MRNWSTDNAKGVQLTVLAATYVALFFFMWWTPRFLLARRLSWRLALPAAAVTSAGLIITGLWSTIWLPKLIVDNAERYGAIGITFGIFTWLYALSLALVAGAVVGGAIADARQDRKPALRTFPA